MDEYILDDHLHADEARLIKEMLNAVVQYPVAFENSFTVERTGHLAQIQGYAYYLSPKGGATSPFRNKQVLPTDCALILFDLKFVETERGHNKSGSWFSFTEAALEWHQQYGGLGADEIRKRIGRLLYRDVGWATNKDFREDEVAKEIGSSPQRVHFETRVLLGSGLVERRFQGTSDFGVLALTEPAGVLWATGGFGPIGDRGKQAVAVNVDLRVEVRNIIQQVQSSAVDPAVLEQYELRLRRVEEELEKPDGQGKLQTVHDLVETANSSKDLLVPTFGFLATHSDKIKTFAEGAGKVVEGIANILPG